MTRLEGKGLVAGRARGEALLTRQPINFTAAFTKASNLLPYRAAVSQDRHHDLYRENLRGKVLIFSAAIGSTYTGLVLLDLVSRGTGPAAVIVQKADPLLVAGLVLSEVWYDGTIPLVEYPGDDIFDSIGRGDTVEVDGQTGEISF